MIHLFFIIHIFPFWDKLWFLGANLFETFDWLYLSHMTVLFISILNFFVLLFHFSTLFLISTVCRWFKNVSKLTFLMGCLFVICLLFWFHTSIETRIRKKWYFYCDSKYSNSSSCFPCPLIDFPVDLNSECILFTDKGKFLFFYVQQQQQNNNLQLHPKSVKMKAKFVFTFFLSQYAFILFYYCVLLPLLLSDYHT